MSNHGKENISVGSHTFPTTPLDVKILRKAFDMYDHSEPLISESWWRELDTELRLYGKKGMGFYYAYMMYLNTDLPIEFKDEDVKPVIAPGYRVVDQGGAGTHRVGELDGVQMIEIEKVFGYATYEGSADNKTQMEWSIIFDDMGDMKVGPTFIYDYKQYDREPDEINYWSIGGNTPENYLAVLLSFYREYGESIFGAQEESLYEEIDTELKYAIDQQYRNDPEKRKEILASLEDDHTDDYYAGGYKELQFDVNPRELVDKLSEKKGYGRVVDEMLGGNGTAYFTSKGNVIKLTGDRSEYETANVIKGKQNKYIADVYESGKLDSSHIINGEGYIIIMEELGLPKRMAETFEDCCCGVNKPIYIEYNETPAVIHPPVDGTEECKKLHKNLLMIRQELTQYGISWSDIGIDNLGMKNGNLALVDLGETTGGIDTGQTIELNEQDQMKLDLPTPLGKFEFPVGYEDFEQENGEIIAGAEQETVDEIKDQVKDEAVTYLFKKWDKTGINFDDLKLLGIPSNNSLIRVMLIKRYLKNTMKSIPVSHTFDCEELSKMFIKDARDYSVDYIEQFLCGQYEWEDYDNWYDHEWYDGMSDSLDDRNWKTIMNILGVSTQDEAENLVNDRPQTEEEERIAEEKEEVISEIRSSILWTHNDESEWRTKKDMGDDVIDKLGQHFEADGKISRDDNGKWSWTIEGDLLDYLEDDMWDNIDIYQYHPDYAGTILEDWLMDVTGHIPQAIFQSLMLEEFTFEDYDYGKRGDLLEPNTKFFDNYYHPDYDINDGLYDRLGEIEHYSSERTAQLDEETDIFGQGLMDPIVPKEFEGTEEEWEELMSQSDDTPIEIEPTYDYTDGKTDPSKGFVAPSKEVTDNICKVEGFCKEQGPITFGQLKALVEKATSKRIQADMGRGLFKTAWRIIPFFIPQILLAAVGITLTRAINKIITPALNDTRGYKEWWGKVVLKAMDIAEGDYIPDIAMGDDPLSKVFFISDGLLQMIRDKYKLKFARYVADYASTRPDNEPVPDWFVENLLRDYLNQKFLLDPPLPHKRGIEVEDLKPTEDKTLKEQDDFHDATDEEIRAADRQAEIDRLAAFGIVDGEKKREQDKEDDTEEGPVDTTPFNKGELLILKHIHRNFDKSKLESLVQETPQYGELSKQWYQLMKMFGIPTASMEQAAASTQYAKYALDNWNEEGDYTMENPIRDMIGWYDVEVTESGSQIEYKIGNVEMLGFDEDDIMDKATAEFYDWDGEMDHSDYGDYETYDQDVEEVTWRKEYEDIPKITENLGDSITYKELKRLDRHAKPYEFFTKIWDKHGPTLDAAVLKLYGVSDWSTGMLRRFLVDYLGGRKQIEKDIREMLPKVSNVVTCGGYDFGIRDTNIQVYEDGSIAVDTLIDPDGDVTLIEADWEGKPISLKLADIANEDHWGMTKHPFRNPSNREWDDGDYYEWENLWGEVDHEIAGCIVEHFSKEIGKRFGPLEINAEYQFDTNNLTAPMLSKIIEGVEGDQEWHTKEQGDFFTLDGSENLGNTDIFKDDGFDIIHQYRGDVHLSDLSPEESETAIPQGSKKVKKTVLKPRLDKGPFNIKVKMNEHEGYSSVEDNPDLNPEVKEGDVIELIYMEDPYSIPIKTKGVVMGFEGKPGDFAYKILVNWIMGPESLSPMALLPDVDIYRFPKKQDSLNEQWEKPYSDPKAKINGKEIDLEVANTEFLKQKGMMYKTSYPKNRGMLFLWDDIVPISMWMRNTFLPLDIIYMVDGEVVDYDKDVQPCEEQQCETYGNVNANQVMELLSGGVDNYNIKIGDKIELVDVQ